MNCVTLYIYYTELHYIVNCFVRHCTPYLVHEPSIKKMHFVTRDVQCILPGFYASFIHAIYCACLGPRFALYLDMHSILRRQSLSHSKTCYVAAEFLCVMVVLR